MHDSLPDNNLLSFKLGERHELNPVDRRWDLIRDKSAKVILIKYSPPAILVRGRGKKISFTIAF